MICPDCNRPVETHKLWKDGRCPVVRFPHYELDPTQPPLPLRPCPPRELGQR